jgi:hypothetical protein
VPVSRHHEKFFSATQKLPDHHLSGVTGLAPDKFAKVSKAIYGAAE